MKRLFLILALLLGASSLEATTYFVASTAGTYTGGTACNGQTAITPTTFNGLTLAAGDITWLCGALTASLNSTLLTIGQDGSSGNPITINFDMGSGISSPACNGSNGCINIQNRSYIVIDGKGTGSVSAGTFASNGIIQNTQNGDSLANQQISRLVNASACTGCVIKNIVLANDYVAVKNTPSPIGGNMTEMNAIVINGSNWQVTNSVIHDCGWCIYDSYGNGDTTDTVNGNEIYNWDHAMMFAAAAANSASGLYFYNNKVHDNVNFENTIGGGSSSDCPYHLDGIHFFGTTGSSMDQIYVYNNWWYGALSGPCSSGFLFAESTASSTPAHMVHSYFWNNFFDATNSTQSAVASCPFPCGNANGWVGIFSSSASIFFANNTMLYQNSNDGTNCYNIGSVSNLTFKNNVINGCNYAVNLGTLGGTSSVDFNFYGDACFGSNNCFIYNGSFLGSFGTWKSTSGFDTNGQISTYSGALLNSDGSPKSGSPVILHAANLGSTATGNLATLAFSTTKGGAVASPVARPAAGTCSSPGSLPCWDVGAYQFRGSAATPTITPSSGTVTLTVTFSSTSGSVICESTTNPPVTAGDGLTCITGAAITTNSGTSCVASSTVCGDVSITSSGTYYAVAGSASLSDSSVASGTYTAATGPQGKIGTGTKIGTGASVQ